MTAFMLPLWPLWAHAVASVLWAAGSALSLWATLRHAEIRRTAWLPVNVAMMLASAWWATLNCWRAFGDLTTPEFQQLVAPLVPPVLVLWGGCRFVFWRRATRAARIEQGLARIAQSQADRERYER